MERRKTDGGIILNSKKGQLQKDGQNEQVLEYATVNIKMGSRFSGGYVLNYLTVKR